MDRFDAGHEHEAKRIATTLRLLLSTAGQTPLMKELRALDEIEWLSLGEDYDERNLAPTNSLTVMRMKIIEGGAEVSYRPRDLSWPHAQWVAFQHWWRGSIVVNNPATGDSFRRMNLVQLLANRDGGAHVGRLSSDEQRLVRNEVTPWAIGSDEDDFINIDLSPVPASVRTIATEVFATIDRYAQQLGLDS